MSDLPGTSRHWRPESRDLPAIAALALAYAVVAAFCLRYFAHYANNVTLIWPPSGLALAALLIRGPRLWPGVAIGAALANAINGLPPLPALAVGAGNAAEAAAGFWLFDRAAGAAPALRSLREYALLMLGGAAACLVAATAGAATLATAGAVSWPAYPGVWLTWWMGDALGVALVTPALLAWTDREFRPPPATAWRWLHLAGLLAALSLVGAIVVFGPASNASTGHAAALAIFPALIWAALAYGRRGASATALVTALFAILSATLHVGHFAQEMQEAGMFNIWLQTLFAAVTGMTVGTLVDERRRTDEALRQSQRKLAESEANFRSLAQSAAVLIWVSGTDKRCQWFNRAWLEFTGRTLEQEIGDGWTAGVHPDDRQHCQMIYEAAFDARRPFSMEYRLRDRHGEYRWIVDHGAPRHDDAGCFLGYSGACWDVSEQHAAVLTLKERERLLRTIYDTSSVAICLVDPAGRITLANERMAEMFGWPQAFLVGTPFLDHVPAEERDAAATVLHRLLADESRDIDQELRHRRRDGSRFWGHMTGRRLVDQDGRLKGLVAVIADIDRRRQAEEQLRLAARVVESSSEGILISDRDNRIVSVNRTFTRITGYAPAEVIGRNPRLLASGRQEPDFYAQMWRSLQTDGRWSGEIWNRRKNGDIYAEWLSIAAVRNDAGEVAHYVGIFSDISGRKEAEARIRHMAEHDHLTGLPNRALLYDRLGQLHAAADRYGRRFAVMFIDLDNFKPVNDHHGHEIGDGLLRVVAGRLRQNVRAADTVARYGGDEFVVLVPEVSDAEEIAPLADKLLTVVAEPYDLDGLELRITPSIGVAVFPDHADSVDMLVRHADAAMYRAKDAGRNRVHIHGQPAGREN